MTGPPSAVLAIEGRVRHYAWGSTQALPGFLGRPPDGRPWAEWWLGAHPQAPSTVGSVPETTLDELVARDPERMLGAAVHARFGARLPFLLKVLAVAHPLSLQVHPTPEQAVVGYRAERAVSPASRDPLYADEWAKPEMLLALTRFDAFAGLRPPAAVLARVDAVGGQALTDLTAPLRADPSTDEVSRLVAALLRASGSERAELVAQTREGVQRLVAANTADSAELTVSADLARTYPDDPAVVVTVLMNHVVLEPGEGMSVPAGLLHCYTGGLAVEIQGTSDNTLRAGLTSKHVDVTEVLRLVDAAAQPTLVPPRELAPGLETFHPGVDDFALDRVCVPRGGSVAFAGGTPAILLGMDGTLVLEGAGGTAQMRRGDAVFVPASAGPMTVSGSGEAVRARSGLPAPTAERACNDLREPDVHDHNYTSERLPLGDPHP